MTLEFGKYRGKTLLELSDLDPSYLIWLAENSIVKVPSDLLNIAINATMEPDFEDFTMIGVIVIKLLQTRVI